ncbi:MAG TPA: DUF2993 domain-containing protein [Limnochordia bacterium]|nr:DUF2993 domain-containing protein [Limnochordia bacterium]
MKRYRLAIAVIAILLVIFGLPRFFLLPRITSQLQREIEGSLQAREVQVQVKAPWGWELFFGRLPGLEFTAWDAVIDDLQVSKVELHGEQIRFDPRLLWQEQELVYTDAENVQGEIVVTESALNELLWEAVDPDRFLSLKVVPEGINLEGTINIWNMEWTVTVTGDLQVHDGTALRYVLKDLALLDTRFPAVLLDVLSDHYEFVIDFGVFPYPVELEDVFLAEQQILITFGGL